MICKPKLYSCLEIEGKVKKLGGYLLNDERTIEPIIKKSWENKEHSYILKNNVIYDLINNINSIPYLFKRIRFYIPWETGVFWRCDYLIKKREVFTLY